MIWVEETKDRKVCDFTWMQPIGKARMSSPRHASADASATQTRQDANMKGVWSKPAALEKPIRKVKMGIHWGRERVSSRSPCRSTIFFRMVLPFFSFTRAVMSLTPASEPTNPFGTGALFSMTACFFNHQGIALKVIS